MRFLATLLTLVRIPLAGLVWVRPESPAWVLSLMALAGITDVLDGALARRARRREGREHARDAGAWLDPLCDKVFVVSALLAVAAAFRPPLWFLPLIAARELAQVPLLGYLRLRGVVRSFDFRAAFVGKFATVLQFAAVAAVLFRHPSQTALAVASGLVGLAGAVYYFVRASRTSAKTEDRGPKTGVGGT